MASRDGDVQTLRNRIVNLEEEVAALRYLLTRGESYGPIEDGNIAKQGGCRVAPADDLDLAQSQKDLKDRTSRGVWNWPLSQEEYRRYGRQMIVPQIGLEGQLRLKNSAVLIVGLGGLGCPAAAYLAGAGVGTLGLIDGDTVEISNLHRQIMHSTRKVGMSKVESAKKFLEELNPNTKYNLHREHLTPETAPGIVAQYDLILDCTDHPTSRYLVSDTAVLLGKPIVSASALRTEGQLMTLNNPPRPPGDVTGGPCYRCIFPKPPPAESVISCGDGGILGPVVGIMGVLQALEGIKLIAANMHQSAETLLGGSKTSEPHEAPSLLLFSAYGSPAFRSVRLRRRRSKCSTCSADASVTSQSLLSGSLDYVQFCGVSQPLNLLREDERISPEHLQALRKKPGSNHVLVDVREKVQFDICHLDGTINVPISDLTAGKALQAKNVEFSRLFQERGPEQPLYVVCRLGNDSQLAVRKLKEAGLDNDGKRYIGDIQGGFKAWKDRVDPDWPEY